jgi:hypothetical protein
LVGAGGFVVAGADGFVGVVVGADVVVVAGAGAVVVAAGAATDVAGAAAADVVLAAGAAVAPAANAIVAAKAVSPAGITLKTVRRVGLIFTGAPGSLLTRWVDGRHSGQTPAGRTTPILRSQTSPGAPPSLAQ